MSAALLSLDQIRTLAARALEAHGASPRQAAALAAGIAAAERDGMTSHGLMYLPTYCEHLTCGKVVGARRARTDAPAPASLVVDAKGRASRTPRSIWACPRLIAAAKSQRRREPRYPQLLQLRRARLSHRAIWRARVWLRSASPMRRPRSRPGARISPRSAPTRGRLPFPTERAARAS